MGIRDGRQEAPTIGGIRADHVARYTWAGRYINWWSQSRARGVASVVDLGCGVGYGSALMASQMRHRPIFATDAAPHAIAYAAEHYAAPNIWWRVSDFTADDYDVSWCAPAAAVVAFEVIEHIERASFFISRALEVAELFIGSVPNENVVPFLPSANDRHFRHYTPRDVEELFGDNGWRLQFFGGQLGRHHPEAEVSLGPGGKRTLVFAAEPASA